MLPKDLLDKLKDSFKYYKPFIYIDLKNDTINLIY